MHKTPDITEKILQSAFCLIQEGGWEGWSYAKISKALDSPLDIILQFLPLPENLLDLLETHLYSQLLAVLDFQTLQEATPKERLFEIILMRLDLLMPYKGGIQVLVSQMVAYPKLSLHITFLQQQASRNILKLAALSTEGPLGYLKEKILMGVYMLTLHKWLEDKTDTLEATMAFLDQSLEWCDQQMLRYQ